MEKKKSSKAGGEQLALRMQFAVGANNYRSNRFMILILCYTKMSNLGLKAEKQLQNENHTEDWALGSHPHVTH